MLYRSYFALLTASFSLSVSAAPPSDGLIHVEPDLRLIKTSETDPGTWVTEDEKIENYVAKDIHFIDVTEITVRQSTPCILEK